MNNEIKQQIKLHALESINREVCGFIINNKVVRCRNIAENNNNVVIHPEDYLKVSLIGKPDFVYHSHNSDRLNFTLLDRLTLLNHNLRGIIYNTQLDKFNVFDNLLILKFKHKF